MVRIANTREFLINTKGSKYLSSANKLFQYLGYENEEFDEDAFDLSIWEKVKAEFDADQGTISAEEISEKYL